MTVESLQKSKEEQPTALAPFRNPEHLSPTDELQLVNSLSSYLEDPYTARFEEVRSHGTLDGHLDEWDADYEREMSNATRDTLDTIALRGKTFLAQKLARGLVNSPLAKIFDERRPSDQLGSVPDENMKERYLDQFSWLQDDEVHLTELEKQALTAQATEEVYDRWGSNDHSLVEQAEKRILERFRYTRKKESCKQAFEEAEAELAQQGYLREGSLISDQLFLMKQFKGDFVAMQNRMWHMAYEMSTDDRRHYIAPYKFFMVAYGDVITERVSEEFLDRFTNFKPMEYSEIVDAGFMYAPVMASTDSIGFYEESGRLVQLFHTTEGLRGGETAEQIDIDTYIHEVLIGASDVEVEATAQTFYLLAGNLQVRNIMERALGVRLDTLSLDDQILLCKLLVRATPEQMESVTQQDKETVRNIVRALEFGDDYGDKILSIAENSNTDQSKEIFETINRFREHSDKIAKWYEGYDPNLARSMELAMNERLTDALYAIEALARDGRLEVDVAPHRNNPDYENDGRFMMKLESLESGLEVLKNLEKSLALQHEIITAPDVVVSHVIEEGNSQFMIYRFSSKQHGDALLYVRPEGAKGYDRDFEYGNRSGVEASISFIVNPTDPHHLRSDKDPHGVSIRFDREGRMTDESPFSEERDPTREQGSISLDISSGLGDGRNTPVKIGRLIAAGNILRAANIGGEVHLHHNSNHFDQEHYGTKEGFAKLAIYVAHMAEAMMAIQQHGLHGSRYQKLPGILRPEDLRSVA